jgi:hypothetical protein
MVTSRVKVKDTGEDAESQGLRYTNVPLGISSKPLTFPFAGSPYDFRGFDL